MRVQDTLAAEGEDATRNVSCAPTFHRQRKPIGQADTARIRIQGLGFNR